MLADLNATGHMVVRWTFNMLVSHPQSPQTVIGPTLSLVSLAVGIALTVIVAFAEDVPGSVEKILPGTFLTVSQSNFHSQTAFGPSVVFFFDNSRVDGFNGRLAKVLAKVAPKYPKVRFLAYKAGADGLSDSQYLKNFGFTGTPFLAFHNDGKRLGKVDGGPNVGYEQQWVDWIEDRILEHFPMVIEKSP